MGKQYAPVFKKGDDEFIVLTQEFVADDEETAWQIGIGASLIELVLWGARRANRIAEILDGNIPHFPANLGGTPVALIAGPMFDDCTNPKHLSSEAP